MRGPETEKSHLVRTHSGFYDKYMQGYGLDIGFRGSLATASPVLPTATGIELGMPGYDGVNLPYPDLSMDYVFTSHLLEHIPTNDLTKTLNEWFRVLKFNGFLILIVPHKFLYEKKIGLPSRWNGDHKRFYTPSLLLAEVEAAFAPNTYRIRHLCDNDRDFNYSIGPLQHSDGCYEIECVIEKIKAPEWAQGLK